MTAHTLRHNGSADRSYDVIIVGAGFSGLYMLHRLRTAGFRTKILERAHDVGGTWYWNRYPGIACDVESYSYMPLLEEMGYFPTMKFSSGFEILEYAQDMAKRFDFYDRCLFHTTVETVSYTHLTLPTKA